MITKDIVVDAVNDWLQQSNDYFLVDAQLTGDDRIVIEIDHADGVWIDDCAALSRFLQERFGDELGDYELEVGSAGIGQPFKVKRQYECHVGDDVEVFTLDGRKHVGILKAVGTDGFTVTVKEKQVPEGKKRPVLVDVDRDYAFNEVKATKYLLNFK